MNLLLLTGTSSLRRTAQLRRLYPDLVVCDIRGNLNTRLAKLDAKDSKFAGIILAQAGLVRMGWMNRISQVLEPTDMLYAVGQGALAVECRANDSQILTMLQKLMCLNTTCRILAERSFLKTLGGGCSAPVAVWSNLHGEPNNINANNNRQQDVGLSLTGAVWSLDGAIELREKLNCALHESETDLQGRKRAAAGQQEQQQQVLNGNGNSNGNGNGANNSCDSPPATKRARNGNASTGNDSGSASDSSSNSSSPRQQGSPTVICEDASVTGYCVEELLERHIDLARKCPVVGHENNNALNGSGDAAGNGGGGDADTSNANATAHCPLQMNVGQDFMGECPFVSNETKISYASAGKCPVTHTATLATTLPPPPRSSGDEPDNATVTAPSSSKCPFAAMHQGSGLEGSSQEKSGHAKCPFLQKTVQMFDYADEEQPKPQQLKLPVLIEDVDNLFCGLYQHACYSRDIYVKANQLGQTLAELLIKQGALDVMKVAQAEIHSKVGS